LPSIELPSDRAFAPGFDFRPAGVFDEDFTFLAMLVGPLPVIRNSLLRCRVIPSNYLPHRSSADYAANRRAIAIHIVTQSIRSVGFLHANSGQFVSFHRFGIFWLTQF
jgi:hypothetical protein